MVAQKYMVAGLPSMFNYINTAHKYRKVLG